MLKFTIERSDTIGEQILEYLPEECSFYTGYQLADKPHIELILNKISMVVHENRVVDVSGFCGLKKSTLTSLLPPQHKQGILKVDHNLEFGYAYDLQKEALPVYLNPKAGWVCIGEAQQCGEAVEFIKSCIAVLGVKNELVSLWLKPQVLPI